MSYNTRDKIKDEPLVQDTDSLNSALGSEGEILTAETSDKQLATLTAKSFGTSRILGEKNRRHGAPKVQGADRTLTGTFSTSGLDVTGVNTLFTTELAQGDLILNPSTGEYREIQLITNNLAAVLYQAFTVNVAASSVLKRQRTVAERIYYIESSRIGHGKLIGMQSFRTF